MNLRALVGRHEGVGITGSDIQIAILSVATLVGGYKTVPFFCPLIFFTVALAHSCVCRTTVRLVVLALL